MGWVGSRWLSPKASAGVAGGECVCMLSGWEVGVCVCACWRCVWVGGKSVRLCVCGCAGFLLGRMDGGAPVQKSFFWSR